MIRQWLAITTALLMCAAQIATSAEHQAAGVRMQTSMSDIVVELDAQQAPKTVENFLGYVEAGFYDGTIFHRVIDGFMVQGGGFTADYKRKSARPPIVNEADNGLKNKRGTVAMARTSVPNSATSEFFINVVDNDFLNHRGKNPREYGYAVFGRVTRGMDVAYTIAEVPVTEAPGGRERSKPLEEIRIESIRLLPIKRQPE